MQVKSWVVVVLGWGVYLGVRWWTLKRLSPQVRRLVSSPLVSYLVVLLASLMIVYTQFRPVSADVIWWTVVANLFFDLIFFLIDWVG